MAKMFTSNLLHMNNKFWITAEDLGQMVKALLDMVTIGNHRMSARDG